MPKRDWLNRRDRAVSKKSAATRATLLEGAVLGLGLEAGWVVIANWHASA